MVPLYVDENLRGLARWLRFLGFDTKLASSGQPDEALLREAVREGRILFTRDRRLAAEGGGAVRFVKEARTREQLEEVLASLERPAPDAWFSRCVLCNLRLREMVPPDRGSAPDGFSRYWRCDGCGRVFWRGSHYERTRRFLASLAPECARSDTNP